MNGKLIGAEPCYCEKANRVIVVAIFEDEIITGESCNPVKIVRRKECFSFGETEDCSICPKKT